ncbi:unnamed protein product [Peronospora belbahrii]|uniref:Uncharacterized protein n=1 Tax=Peronospora belbahrii TaxID=622444 RepID=A0AAU9KQ69_9STRA|nr:unnamed protein product [Peronospora belbahrii]CAH0520414.1 unnamed protein product [Peronospora belbahrii]
MMYNVLTAAENKRRVCRVSQKRYQPDQFRRGITIEPNQLYWNKCESVVFFETLHLQVISPSDTRNQQLHLRQLLTQ